MIYWVSRGDLGRRFGDSLEGYMSMCFVWSWKSRQKKLICWVSFLVGEKTEALANFALMLCFSLLLTQFFFFPKFWFFFFFFFKRIADRSMSSRWEMRWKGHVEVGHRWDRGIRVVGETWARISTRYMWGLVLDGASFYIFYQLYSFKIKKKMSFDENIWFVS